MWYIYPIVLIIGIVIGRLSTASSGIRKYWQGRKEGWRAREDLSISRAEKCGYNTKKFLEDIIQ